MAISNDERREVAARLRTVTRNDAEEVYLGDILSALIGGFTVTKENNETDELLVIDRLADLIEPEPERTCRLNEFEGIYGCSKCGQIAHVFTRPNYYPNCGARVKEDE